MLYQDKMTKITQKQHNNKLVKNDHNKSIMAAMKTSWIYQTKEFFENSTLHGVRYIAEEGRPFCEKFMWFCFTAVGAVATLIIIVSLWEKFQTNPTITGLDTDFHNWDIPFPAVTVCQDQEPYDNETIADVIKSEWNIDEDAEEYAHYELFLQKMSLLSYENIGDLKEYFDDKLILTSNLRTLIYKVRKPCSAVFHNCIWKGLDYPCCPGFLPVLTERGLCYSLNSKHAEIDIPILDKDFNRTETMYILETDLKWAFSFKPYGLMSWGYKVFLYSYNEVFGLDLYPILDWYHNYEILYFSVKKTYTTEEARQLSISQRRCVFGDELKIQGSEEYTYSACMRQCRINRCKHKCNCVPHFYPVVKGDKMCTIKDLQCIYQNANFIKNVLHCNCELGCTNKVYELEKLGEAANTNHSNNKDVQINVRSDISLNLQFLTWPMVQYKREVLFGWVDLLVSFGGIAGLFLGFSLLSGVEIIYYFTMRACCMLYRNKEELYEVETKSKMERVTYNLSLKTSLNMNNKVNPMIGVHNRPDGVPNYRGTMMVRPQMYQ